MRIGMVADIHEAIEPLQQALAEFRRRGVDQIVSLGDACDLFASPSRAREVATLLLDHGAVGVWGNHDFDLCDEVSETVRQRTVPDVLEYMATMQPQLVIENCRFSHVVPWLDARRPENLWHYEDLPDLRRNRRLSFAAVPERCLFMGHYHRWLAITPAGRIDWSGERPLMLGGDMRHLIVVAPVCRGWCAVYDTVECELAPIRCADQP